MRFGHRLVTRTSTRFVPACSARVTSARKGGFHRIPPIGVPFTDSSAISLTVPRSISTCEPGTSAEAGIVKSFACVAVPEKYFTPASAERVHDVRLSSRVVAGAPRFGWNRTSHGPETVARSVRANASTVRDATDVARRKTTKVDPYGSRWSDTSVRPPRLAYDAGWISPVAASHSSGSRPLARKDAATSRAWSR